MALSDLYPSNGKISDILETYDDLYTVLYQELNNPQKPKKPYTQNKATLNVRNGFHQ